METKPQQPAAPTLVPWQESREKGWPTSGVGVLMGPPKQGKTTLAADMPGAYVLELDTNDAEHVAGRIHNLADTLDEHGDIAVVPGGDPAKPVYMTKLWHFRQALRAAKDAPDVKTIVIDTLDALAALFMEEIAAKNGVASMMSREKGVNTRDMWGELASRFEGLVEYLNQCGKLAVFVSHLKSPEKDDEGKVIAPAKLNISGKSAEYIAGRAKFLGNCYKAEVGGELRYYVSFKGGPLANLGSRVKELNNRTIELPEDKPFSAIEAVFKAKKAEAKEPAKPAEKAPAAAGKKEEPAPARRQPPRPKAAAAAGR